MVEQGRAFLNSPPDRIFLVRPESHIGRRAHKLQMRAVITGGNVGVEALVIERGQHVPPLVVRPDPIQKGLADFVGLLHGGCGQLLVNHHNGPVVVIELPAFLFHLDGPARQQGFNNFTSRVFRNAPDVCVEGGVPNSDRGFPAAQGGNVADGLLPLAGMKMLYEI